jgi:hypothetical protein
MLERIDKLLQSSMISNWERSFCESIRLQIKRGKTLSPKQSVLVQKIEGKVETETKGYDVWIKEWDLIKDGRWTIATRYYQGIGSYFLDLIYKRDHDSEWIPTESQYRKLTENKYAAKIIAEIEKEPLFAPGQQVAIRTTARSAYMQNVDAGMLRKLQNLPLFIVRDLKEAHRAAKGARMYLVLPAGLIQPIAIEERFLKKHRCSKTKK